MEYFHFRSKMQLDLPVLYLFSAVTFSLPFQIGHSAFHKLGRLEDEWTFVLPILIKRIVAQYADLRQYKKDSLCKVEKR